MKEFMYGFKIGFVFYLMAWSAFFMAEVCDISYNIKRTTDYILSTQEIVSGQHDELKELRAITDEFRAQIKGLQKEVLIGIQEGGM